MTYGELRYWYCTTCRAFALTPGIRALCPVSLARLSGHTRGNGRVRAYYIAVSRAYLRAPALVGGYTYIRQFSVLCSLICNSAIDAHCAWSVIKGRQTPQSHHNHTPRLRQPCHENPQPLETHPKSRESSDRVGGDRRSWRSEGDPPGEQTSESATHLVSKPRGLCCERQNEDAK